MKNTKSLVAAVALAAASFASAPVLAQVGSTQALSVIDNTAFYGDTFEAAAAGQTFTDRFTFTVEETIPQTLNAIVSSISNQPSTGLDITGLSLYDATDALISSGTALNGGRIDVWTLSNNMLDNGRYVMEVRGNVLGNASMTTGGSFGGAVMLAPVPEPETYGMMLGGLGILAFMARNRKSKQA
jgi:hypothetical protein